MTYRSFQSDTTFYKYTSKERDVTTGYDYFGARYYNSRIGRWGQVEPLLENYFSLSPFVYTGNNPLNNIDLWGRKIKPIGDGVDDIIDELNTNTNETGLTFNYNKETKLIEVTGEGKTEFAKLMKEAADDKNLTVEFHLLKKNSVTIDGKKYDLFVGLYGGSTQDGEKVTATQYFNLKHAKVWEEAGGSNPGYSIMHEITEAFYGAQKFPGKGYDDGFKAAHDYIKSIEPVQYYPEKVFYSYYNTYYFRSESGKDFKLYSK